MVGKAKSCKPQQKEVRQSDKDAIAPNWTRTALRASRGSQRRERRRLPSGNVPRAEGWRDAAIWRISDAAVGAGEVGQIVYKHGNRKLNYLDWTIFVRGHIVEDQTKSGKLRELTHNLGYLLWQQAKLGQTFEGEKALHVKAMRDHPEYYDVWEHANEFLQESVEIDGVNPFLHVTMHTIVENQIAQGQPPEPGAVVEYKTSHNTPRHQCIHEIGVAFTRFLHPVLLDNEPFDEDAYRRELIKMLPRSKRPTAKERRK
jgi:hypothetical protein